MSCLRTNVVDVKADQVSYIYTCCRPNVCCCQDWMDHFEGESLFGCLFEQIEQIDCYRNRSGSESASTTDPVIQQQEVEFQTTTFSLTELATGEWTVEHAGMVSTKRKTLEDQVHHPSDSEVSCRPVASNRQPQMILNLVVVWVVAHDKSILYTSKFQRGSAEWKICNLIGWKS